MESLGTVSVLINNGTIKDGFISNFESRSFPTAYAHFSSPRRDYYPTTAYTA
jgi:hypothetical protein